MGTKTEHYQLNQWEPEDNFLRTDFNEDNAKIDAALGDKTEITFGSYNGTGTDNRVISLPFTPRVVFLCNEFGQTYNSPRYYGGLALEGHPAKGSSSATGEVNLITIQENGFKVRHGSVQSGSGTYLGANLSGTTYHYFALR